MNYPLISDYIEAIKSAEDNFQELTNLRPVLTDDGQPVLTSGNFAVVFKMKDTETGQFYALKCFTKDQEGRGEAYHQIAEELKDVESPYLISIQYLDKELFVDTDQTTETEFPVLLMDWVEGKTLDKYLRENLDDKYALEMLAYRFSQLAQWLIPQPFAHGDLKPDNILVCEDGTMVLVDYDGMYVPAMKGQKARELGPPDFRHPLRTENDFDDHMDDYSLICLTLSLRAISIDSSLLSVTENDNVLLLSEKDIRDFANSKMIKILHSLSGEPDYLNLLGAFYICCANKDFSDISFKLFDVIKPNKKQGDYGYFTDPRDGYTYKTIKIGNQTWLAENLRYLPKLNYGYYVYGYHGWDISEAKRTQNYKLFGVLYDMYSAKEACPQGWHIPSVDEWNDLELHWGLDNNEERIILMDDTEYHFIGQHGINMINRNLWKDGFLKKLSINNALFNAVPGGWRTGYGKMEDAFILSKWWTSTRLFGGGYYYRGLYYNDIGVERGDCSKSCCLSLRCIKDDENVSTSHLDEDLLPF